MTAIIITLIICATIYITVAKITNLLQEGDYYHHEYNFLLDVMHKMCSNNNNLTKDDIVKAINEIWIKGRL